MSSPCALASTSTYPPAIVNALNRERASKLAFNLTAFDADSGYLPLTLQRLPHVKERTVWGPPSWQYDYQLRAPAEQSTMKIVQHLAKQRCEQDGPTPLVVELGANEGSYGRTASAYGCRVISVEPQAACLRMLAYAVAMVPSRHTACLVHGFVSDTAFSMNVPAAPCSGLGTSKDHDRSEDNGMKAFGAPVQVMQPEAEAKARMHRGQGFATSARSAVVRSVAVDSLVNEDVLLIKCDVEGAEVSALSSAARLFATRKVHNMIVEFKPSAWRLPFAQGWATISRVPYFAALLTSWLC